MGLLKKLKAKQTRLKKESGKYDRLFKSLFADMTDEEKEAIIERYMLHDEENQKANT